MSPTSRGATGPQGQARSPSLRLAARRARGYTLNQPRDVWEAIELLKRIRNIALFFLIGLVGFALLFLAARFYLARVFRDYLGGVPQVSQRIGAVAEASVDFSDTVPFCQGAACKGFQRFVSRLRGAKGDLVASFDYNMQTGDLRALALCNPDGSLLWKSEDLKLIQDMDCR